MEYIEAEFKYKADNIGLKKALEVFESIDYKKKLEVGSWDIYYTSKDKPFIRDRQGTAKSRELTSKQKTVEHNNNVRKEVNVHVTAPVDEYNTLMDMIGADSKHKIGSKLSKAAHFNVTYDLDEVLSMAKEELGYKENFRIYKICWIYWTKDVNVVYYTVFNEDFKETGRFLEIEANQDKNWASEEEAIAAVTKMEKEHFIKFGITSKNRMNKSLFEINERKE